MGHILSQLDFQDLDDHFFQLQTQLKQSYKLTLSHDVAVWE